MSWNEPSTYVILEHRDDALVALHEMTKPGRTQPQGYISSASFNAFADRMILLRCAEGPLLDRRAIRWFYVDFHRTKAAFAQDRAWDAQRHPGLPSLYDGVPVFTHTTLFEFYAAIGWDHKAGKLTLPEPDYVA